MRIIRNIVAFSMAVTMMLHTLPSYASNEPELIKKRATAYNLTGKTCTGKEVREGLAASSDKSLIGKTIIMYQRLPGNEVGEIIGIYEIEDTGDMSEHVIDVWSNVPQSFMDRVYEDGCEGKVFIQIFEAEG